MSTRYKVDAGESLVELEVMVNQSLGDGWKLAGGLVVNRTEVKNTRKGYTEDEWLWAQAMYKEETGNG